MLWVDGGGGSSSTLGGMFPARVGHNAPSVQAGPQELVLQQGRGGHQWPDDVNHPEPIHSDKQPPPSRPPPPPPPLFCFLPSPPSSPPHILFCWTKTRAAGEHATAPQLNGLEVRGHTPTHIRTCPKFLTYIMGIHAYTHVHTHTQEQTLSVLLMTPQASWWDMNWY